MAAWLSDELWVAVFARLNAADVCRCACVCTRWNRIANDHHLWRRLFLAEFSLHVDGQALSPSDARRDARSADLRSSWQLRRGHGATTGSVVVPSPRRYGHWKEMYAVRHNWTAGNAAVAEFAAPAPASSPTASAGAIVHVQCSATRVLTCRRESPRIDLWAVDDGRPVGTIDCGPAAVTALRLCAAPWLASVDADALPDGHGLLLAVGLADGGFQLWDLAKLRQLASAAAAEDGATAATVAVAVADHYVATAGADGSLAVWRCPLPAPGSPAAPLVTARRLFELHGPEPGAPIALLLDCQAFARTRLRSAQRLRVTVSYGVAAVHPQRAQVLCCQTLVAITDAGGSTSTPDAPPAWTLPTTHTLARGRFSVLGPHPEATCLRFDASRRVLVSGHTDNAIRVFASEARGHFRLACTLYGHTGAVTCLEFDGFKVVSGSRDCSIKVWSLATGECDHTFQGHLAPVVALVFDEQRICSADELGMVKLWSFRHPAPVPPSAKRVRIGDDRDAP